MITKIQEKYRIFKNIAVISMAFMLNFTAYSGAANLQSSINQEGGLGTASLASVYTGALLSNLFLPAIILKWLGIKWTMCFSFIAYMPYIACQMYSSFYTLVPAAFLTGLGAGPLWCAQGTYLALSAEIHSSVFGIPAGTLLQRFFGFFYMSYHMAQIWGNLLSSLVLSAENDTPTALVNNSMAKQICGANYLASLNASEAPALRGNILMLAGIYLVCMNASTVLIAIALDPFERCESRGCSKLSGLALLTVTVKHLSDPNQMLLVVFTMFTGINRAFFIPDFTSSFLSCAMGTSSVGYVMISYGVANAVFSLTTGYLAKSFGRLLLFCVAFLVQVAVLITLLLWTPQAEEYYVMFIIAALWGFCDAIWTVQLNAYYGVLFSGKEEAAFSNYRLWEGFGFTISYLMSSYVRTRSKIFLLLAYLVLGILGYFTVGYRKSRHDKVIVDKDGKVGKM